MSTKPSPITPLSDVEPVGAQVQLLVQLLKLSSLINRPMQQGVANANGLGLNEVKVIVCLGGEGALAGHELAEILAMTTMNASRALTALLERGWVEPEADPANRRRKPYKLSEAGWAGYRAMTPDVSMVAAKVFESLSKSESAAFARIIDKIIARVEMWPAA
ncbi:MAG TPA: MarR family winged helix-turn-helix transcriptional regulator [Sphingomonas sp.]|nr:MarR family winged helix-turn-helix transcriptional regulator [Sphingomonas sp.]